MSKITKRFIQNASTKNEEDGDDGEKNIITSQIFQNELKIEL